MNKLKELILFNIGQISILGMFIYYEFEFTLIKFFLYMIGLLCIYIAGAIRQGGDFK